MVRDSPPSETIAPGTVIAGRFTLQRLAGQGGVGLVYQARDSQTERTVALKLLHTLADPESARRFVREAEFLAGLHHPGIVSYVAHGLTDERQPFLAMEWLEGEDVARRLARQPLALSETLMLSMLMPFHLLASRSLCLALLAQGHAEEARTVAERGVQVLEKMGGEGSGAVGAWLSLAEACLAQGETAAAEKALRKAQQGLAVRAGDIPDPEALECFLSQMPENARTRELVRQRWGTDWDGAHVRVP